MKKNAKFVKSNNTTMKTKIFFALVIASFLVLSSCTKMKEGTLEGRWRQIQIAVDTIGAGLPISVWEFKSGELIIYEKETSTDLAEVSRAKYTLGFNGSEYTLNLTQMVSGKDLNWIKADGRIIKLNDSYFKWFNKNGFYGEFVRYE